MKLREIFAFELVYQARRLSTSLFFVVLVVFSFLFVRGSYLADALYQDFYLNAPFIIAGVTIFGSLISLLVTATVTGELATRDAETGMHPLTYTAPVTRGEYLGGRFLAAFTLTALLQLAVPLGSLAAVYGPGVDPEVIGPFRPAAYLTAYGYIALPNTFLATSIQFAWAALGRRAIASFLGSVLLFFVVYGGMFAVGFFLDREDLMALLDAFGHVFITSDAVLGWTPLEKNVRLIELEGTLLRSRVLWFGVALASLAFTYSRFRFAHPTPGSPLDSLRSFVRRWSAPAERAGRGDALDPRAGEGARAPTGLGADGQQPTGSVPTAGLAAGVTVSTRQVRRTFGFATRARQTLEIAWASFRGLARSRTGPVLLVPIAAVVVVVLPQNMHDLGTPLLPRTEYVLSFLTTPLTNPLTPWVIIPLLIVLFSGELVWRERQAGMGEITDAAPVPDWVLLLGRFIALTLVLLAWAALLTLAGVLVQVRMGYAPFEIGLYARVLFGLQLPEYLLFALLALVVQGLVQQKYVGHLAALLAYAWILFAGRLGIGHNLLVYGAGPTWRYGEMSEFGASVGPWLWFKLYWAAWALLLAAGAKLLWVRGLESDPAVRLRIARGRFTRATARAAAVAGGLVLALGGFVFYNTNVLNEYVTGSERKERSAEYERRYGRYAGIPQPRLTATNLRVEIHPRRGVVEISGTYTLVNGTGAVIDSIHIATTPAVETGAVAFDRPARPVLLDDDRGHRIYALERPLQPGDSLDLHFDVRLRQRGFGNGGRAPFVTEKSTFFRNEWLPTVGYQPGRELIGPRDRRTHGLPARPLFPLLADVDAAARDVTGEGDVRRNGADRIDFEAVVGTAADQVAVAPGVLRRSWTEGGRRYFHYVSDAPIGAEQSFFSAAYAVYEERWQEPTGTGRHPAGAPVREVAIQVFYHPKHGANLDRMVRSVRASLEHNTREFGPYPFGYIRLVENSGTGIGAHAAASMIDYTEGSTRFDPAADPRGLDMPFAIMAHEMAHQWQVPYAYAEGAPLLSESFAWYAAMGVVEETYGRDHLEKLRRFFRQPYPIPPIRQSVPLLRAMDPYAAYRKGPFALYALHEYVGKEGVNLAFRRLREAHGSGEPPLPTSLDLYRQLEAVTPDSLRYLLHDLFEANTFWELETERATAIPGEAGGWEVTLDVHARKVTVDPAGMETEVPMDEWIPIGVFAPTGRGADFGETLYLRMHRIRTGAQTITVAVADVPSDAGIDPFHLLIELERFDNVERVEIGG